MLGPRLDSSAVGLTYTMESSACPVCTLFLREGISLEEHLETHPKDQVIEALVNSIRHRDTESQHVTNGYAMQTLPLRSSPYYELPSQCLPLQSYQSNSIAYQQLLSSNSVPPISPSPYVPVTMFMASSGSASQPALMQMVCNPYNVMQIQQQQQQSVQLVNQRSSGQNQPTSMEPRPIVSPLSNSSSSFQHRPSNNSAATESNHGVPMGPATTASNGPASHPHSSADSSHDDNAVQDRPSPANAEDLQSSCSTTAHNNGSALGPIIPRPATESPLCRLYYAKDAEPPALGIFDGNRNSGVLPTTLPILRNSPADVATINPGSTNRVRVIRVNMPPQENLCFDPKLLRPSPSLPSDSAYVCSLSYPRKVVISNSTTEIGKTYQSLSPKSKLHSLRTELCDLVTPYNNNDESTVQEPEYVDLPQFDNSTLDSVPYRSNIPRNSLPSATTDVLNNVLEKSNGSSQRYLTNNVSDLQDGQVDKSPLSTLKPMDLELSRINLTDLGSKPCSSKRTERIDASDNSPVNRPVRDEYCTEVSNSAFQSPKSPSLRVRTDLSKIANKDGDDLNNASECQIEAEILHETPQSASPRPALSQKSVCPDPFLESNSNTKSNSPRNNEKSISPDLQSESVNSKSNDESRSCSSSPKSASPGLRIRTDLSSDPSSESCMKRQERHLKAQHLLSQLDSNEVNAVLGMVRSSLEIQLPPVSVPDSDEYITSDCNYNEDNDLSDRLVDHQGSSANETKTEVSSSVKAKTLLSNFHQSNSNDEVVSFEPTSPVHIIEIDDLHIIVPRQFYEDPHDGTPSARSQSDQNFTRRNSHIEITPLQNVNRCTERRLSLREFSKKNDDTEVSTSYDLLARESWAASDGSDTEINADCNVSTPIWDDVPERRPVRYGKGKAGRVYKCITCGESFNCPKERRVHCSTHRSEKAAPIVLPVPPAELVKSTEQLREEMSVRTRKRQSAPKPAMKKIKKARKGMQVLFVRNESTNFMGVFLKDTGEENKMQSEENDEVSPPIDPVSLEENSEVKKELKKEVGVKDEKKDVKTILPIEKTVQCMTCNELFQTKKHLQQHVRLTHNGGEWKHMCDCCQEVFTTELLYNEHLRIHPLECKQCSKNFYRRQNLLVHMKRHLGIRPYKCNMCEKAFLTKQKMNEHQNSHTGAAPIKCPLCPMSFRRYSNLIQHKNRTHYKIKKKIKDFVCFCGEVFHSRKKLDWHKEIHDEKPKCCPSCSERFIHTASLTRHIRRAHDRRYMPKIGRENENVECTICGHVFLKSSLIVHMRLHSGERPYSCPVCGKTFATKWNLQQHRWVHASRSSKPFKCSLCKGAFAREGDYNQHMDSHRNKRPYTCNVCGEQFVRKPNCLRHMKEHEAGKTFFCNECGKSFHRGYYLKDHMRVHTGVRPHVCHICGKASSTKSNHNKHVKIHHAREPVNTES